MPAHKTPLKMYKHIAASQVVAGPMAGAMKSMKLYPLSLTQTVILYGMNSLANGFQDRDMHILRSVHTIPIYILILF